MKPQFRTAFDPPSRRMPTVFVHAMAMGLLCPSVAMAQLVAADSFLTGGDWDAGEYLTPGPVRTGAMEGSPGSPDIGLVWQVPVIPGFTGEWLIANGALGEVAPFGMGVSGFGSTGGMGSTDVNNHGTRFGHQLATSFTNATSGTYYMSIVLMGNQDFWSHGYRAMELHDGGFDDGTNRRFQLGIHKVGESSAPDPGDFGATHYWGFRVNNSGSLTRQFPYQGVDSTEANLFVIKFVMSAAAGGDSVTVWHNPAPASFGGAEPAGGITVSGFDLSFDRVSFASWENPFWFNPYDGALFFDEIRLGTSWAAVTPEWQLEQPDGDFLVYEFNGWLEGWEELTTPNINWGPQRWMGSTGGDARSIPDSPGAAKQYLHLDARWPGGADLSHPTLWMRSPPFRLNGAGDLTFWIMGGGTNTNPNAFVPANDTEVPANSADTLDGGFHGVVLRNADTGAFVLIGNRSSDDFDWQQVTFTAAQLATLDPNATYTLDAIDARNNAWSWFNLDSVSIPGTLALGPPPATTISKVLNQTIPVNTSTGPLPFTLADDDKDPATLTVTGTSSDTFLIPNASIELGGSGANRTVTVTPAPGELGSATITLTVTNGTVPASSSFVVNVITDAMPVVYNFDDGTAQGWTEVSTDSQANQFLALVPPSVSSPNITPQAGSHFVGLHIPGFYLDFNVDPSLWYTQDSPHTTLLWRSPEFTLNGAGDLVAWLAGGGQGSPSLAGTAVNALNTNSVDGGFRGIALRSATSGFYELSASKTSNGNEWQQVTFTAALLEFLPQGHVYTLDFIDAAHGGWGWVNLDSVTIPGTPVGGAEPFRITSFDYNAAAKTYRLTWNSQPGRTYTLRYTTDLSLPGTVVQAAIASGGATTTWPAAGDPPAASPLPAAPKLFFYLEEVP